MKTNVRNQVSEIRKSRGISASDLAHRVKVTRQTIYAIEAGTYVPNTEVALRLAQALEVTVDGLFTLEENSRKEPGTLAADVLSGSAPLKGQPVRVGQVGSRWVSVPVSASPYYMPEADGVVERTGPHSRRAELLVFATEETSAKRLVLAGCDPAAGLLAHTVEKIGGIETIPAAASSRLALTWLKEGKVHIAGSHLEDANIRKEFPDKDFSVITFAHWEEGLVVRPGNPKRIRKIEDLGRKTVRFINREPGSGSRALLDRLMREAGIDSTSVRGYDHIVAGHLTAAYAVFAEDADCCLATQSAAQAYGLDFVPLHRERYDFVLRRETLDLPIAQAFLDVLQRAALRRKVESLAGYDTTSMGAVIG